MEPTRCITSHLTTELLEFRNPQGIEENWINGGGQIHNLRVYCGKVFATEIALSILSVTAAVETVAYATLFAGFGTLWVISLPLSYINHKPKDKCELFCGKTFSLLESSAFTLFWNIGNVTIFNPFCKNVFTHESFARFSMDHWTRGKVFKVAFIITTIVVICYLCSKSDSNNKTDVSSAGFISPNLNFNDLDIRFLRNQDSLYIADRMLQQQNNLGNLPAPMHVHPLIKHGQNINSEINKGALFFKDFILDHVDAESKQKILDSDPDIYLFALTRAIYIYTFGDKCSEKIPDFFKTQTQWLIDKMRKKHSQSEGCVLESAMLSLEAFEEEPDDLTTKTILNDLKKAAHGEFQGGLLITKCWQKACE